MFAQLKKKIEDKENANIPHVVAVSPISLRDQSESESKILEPPSNETPVRTRKISGDEERKAQALQDGSGASNDDHLDQRRSVPVVKDERTTRTDGIDVSDHDQRTEVAISQTREKDALIRHLQKDKLELEQRLQETVAHLNRVVKNNENAEELESLQAEELAKIKHLLLRSQQELSQKEETIRRCNEELRAANRKLSAFEAEVVSLRRQFDALKIGDLQLEKKSLEEEIDRLKQDALRNSSLLEVKDQSISQLQERVTVLEKRLNDTALTGDDVTKAILAERTSLENKLEESHQQLNEIKSTWSEKIHSLETQIFHLNKKMAEDSEESSQVEKKLVELRGRFEEQQEKTWTLEERLKSTEHESEDLKNANSLLDERSRENESNWKSKVDLLQGQMSDLVKEHNREKQEEQAKITKLVAAQSEHVEKDIELERHITELEDENRRQKAELTKKGKECANLREEVASLHFKLEEVEVRVINVEKEKHVVESELESVTKELDERRRSVHSLTEECDRLMMRNAELSHDLEFLRRETEEEGSNREKEREDCETTTLHLQHELEQAKNKISELDETVTNNCESGSQIVELKIALSNYETDLADKNKTIKLQQQRLADMKKALQRELKAQTESVELGPSQTKDKSKQPRVQEEDINFKYLKHVIFKFMTCSEYEGQHLVRAICALLRFSHDEEQLIKETLEWKSSWFGIKPRPFPS